MTSPILDVQPLGFPWQCLDPFLFCAHHDDRFPAGNAELGPAAGLEGRRLGQDFAFKDGWNMYHGERVPGFPQHPHRGFETVTIVRQGLVDHADSLGATARYGEGDVQWLTTGAGISHSEMFPLLRRDQGNPADLFQVWLNLSAAKKMAPPAFTMLWDRQQPRVQGDKAEWTLVAGSLGQVRAPAPPKDSYASQDGSEVLIGVLTAQAGGCFKLPAAPQGVNRCLYLFKGDWTVQGEEFKAGRRLVLRPDAELELASAAGAEMLILQGRPLGEPVFSYGPFVMNERQEVMQAIEEYQRTRFGGWPWDRDDPTHPADQGRFARHADGRLDRP